MWNLHTPGTEPLSPVLAGEFLTAGPPSKSYHLILTLATWSLGQLAQIKDATPPPKNPSLISDTSYKLSYPQATYISEQMAWEAPLNLGGHWD